MGGGIASGLLLAGEPLAGYMVAGAVVLPAALAALTGICVGCPMHRQVALFRRPNIV